MIVCSGGGVRLMRIGRKPAAPPAWGARATAATTKGVCVCCTIISRESPPLPVPECQHRLPHPPRNRRHRCPDVCLRVSTVPLQGHATPRLPLSFWAAVTTAIEYTCITTAVEYAHERHLRPKNRLGAQVGVIGEFVSFSETKMGLQKSKCFLASRCNSSVFAVDYVAGFGTSWRRYLHTRIHPCFYRVLFNCCHYTWLQYPKLEISVIHGKRKSIVPKEHTLVTLMYRRKIIR